MQIRRIKVSNFRGIATLDWKPGNSFCCLIGPGDSGKSTVLDAVEACLSSRWFTFAEPDFTNADTTKPITIEATLGELSAALKSDERFGLYIRGWTTTGELRDEPEDDDEPVLTVRLTVDATMEPSWELICDRTSDPRTLSNRDRTLFGLVRLAGDDARQLAWGQGSVLSRLTGNSTEAAGRLAQAYKAARENAKLHEIEALIKAAEAAEEFAKGLGAYIDEGYSPGLELGRSGLSSGSIALHDGSVPLRLAGLGTRRLATLGLQKSAIAEGAIVLVDEIEHGLEPHRILGAISQLKSGQENAKKLSAATTVDNSAVLASLAPAPQLHVSIAVNFDPSAGLLTGLSVLGRATAYVSGQSPRQFAPKCFVVDQKSLADEWVALEGLLSTLSDMVDQAEAFVRAAGKTPLTAQIAFWEQRQFEELCAAMGRHLPRVLSLTNRKTKALAWLFPADELIEKPDGAVSPCIVFIDEIVRRVVFAPTPHVITLFDTAETYYSGSGPVRLGDAYYREFLTNGIPRERIYEIWSNVTIIKRGSVTVPRNTVIQEFGNALEKQCRALNSVVERLRTDFKGQLKANAPKLTLSIPQGSRDVAFDSKLWIWWEELQFQTRKLESHQRLALDSEALEASYEAVRLTNGQPTGAPNEYIFDVLPGSTEAKLDDNESYLALGKEGFPGLPLQRGRDLIPATAPPYSGQGDTLLTPLWSALSVTLVSFDRGTRKAVLKLSNWREAAFAPYLLANSTVDLLNDIFITKGQGSFKWYETVKKILASVGNPSIAVADRNAATAMGANAVRPGTAAITPLARILWEADIVHATSVVTSPQAASVGAAKLVGDVPDEAD